MSNDPYIAAAVVVNRLWKSLLLTKHQPSMYAQLFPQLFDRALISDLFLPLGDQKSMQQSVALAEGSSFERSIEQTEVTKSYSARPRTRVYEGIDVGTPEWYTLVSLQLSRLARCRVACSMYESSQYDAGLVKHIDAWDGIILQMRGEKTWNLGGPQPDNLTTRLGDVLILPEGVQHSVSTARYSVHLVFAVIRNTPLVERMRSVHLDSLDTNCNRFRREPYTRSQRGRVPSVNTHNVDG